MQRTLIAVNPTEHYEELFSNALKLKYIDNVIKSTPENFLMDTISVISAGDTPIFIKGLIETKDFLRLFTRNKNELIENKDKLLSHCSIFNENFLATDVAFNTYPSAADKLQITKNALELYKKLFPDNKQIKISALTPAGKCDQSHSAVDAKFVEENLHDSDAYIAYEQLDSALYEEEAKIKGKTNWAPTDIFLCHDYESGNILYKAFTKLSKFSVAGLILGAKGPICLNSRGDAMDEKLL